MGVIAPSKPVNLGDEMPVPEWGLNRMALAKCSLLVYYAVKYGSLLYYFLHAVHGGRGGRAKPYLKDATVQACICMNAYLCVQVSFSFPLLSFQQVSNDQGNVGHSSKSINHASNKSSRWSFGG